MSDDWTRREKRLMAWVEWQFASHCASIGHGAYKPHSDAASRLEREAAGAERAARDVEAAGLDEDRAAGLVAARGMLDNIAGERKGPDSAAADMLYQVTEYGGGGIDPVGFTLAQVRRAIILGQRPWLNLTNAERDEYRRLVVLILEAEDGK